MYGMYNPQIAKERIDTQIAQLQQMKDQLPPIQQPTNLTQNFQLAPTGSTIKYANNIEDVKKELVVGDTPYFSNDLSIMWLKNIKGNIRCFELKEIVEKDEKDLQIEYLTNELNKLKGMIENEHITDDEKQNISTSTSDDDGAVRKQTKNE